MIDQKKLNSRINQKCSGLAQDLARHLVADLPGLQVSTYISGGQRQIQLRAPNLKQFEFGSWEETRTGRLHRLLHRFLTSRRSPQERTEP